MWVAGGRKSFRRYWFNLSQSFSVFRDSRTFSSYSYAILGPIWPLAVVHYSLGCWIIRSIIFPGASGGSISSRVRRAYTIAPWESSNRHFVRTERAFLGVLGGVYLDQGQGTPQLIAPRIALRKPLNTITPRVAQCSFYHPEIQRNGDDVLISWITRGVLCSAGKSFNKS